MTEGRKLWIGGRLAIPESELEYQCSRASGPGGQHVNVTDTVVQLRFHVLGSPSLPDEVRVRLLAIAGRSVTSDGWLLADEEPSEAGTVKTLLRFADGRVTLTRRGAVRSEMTFAAGECHTIFYELPLGRLTMELHTDSACASFDGACGTLELCYRLTVRDETVSENRLTVTLAPR